MMIYQQVKMYVAKMLPYILLFFVFTYHFGRIMLADLGVSIFKGTLDSDPAYWWPVSSIATWASQIAVMIAMFILFKTLFRGDPKWSVTIAVTSLLLTLATIYLNSQYGVAVFDDSILVRKFGIGTSSNQIYRLSEVTETKIDCEVVSARGAVSGNPSYVLVFGDHRQIDLNEGVDMDKYSKPWLSGLTLVDNVLSQRNVNYIRNPLRSDTEYNKCVNMLVKRVEERERAVVAHVFMK